MPLSSLGPRVLLRRLREVMARPEPAQKKLDAIVTLIAANMVAEVCSLYVLRPGRMLELYATEGLKREAVHKSKLQIGEGLVGTIAAEAEPLNLSDAQSASSVQISAGNRRRNLSLLPRRADFEGRRDDRRAGGAKPHEPPVFGRRRGGAADHRDGAGGGDRIGRDRRSRAGGRSGCRAYQEPSSQGQQPGRGHSTRPCGAARAAHHHHKSDR